MKPTGDFQANLARIRRKNKLLARKLEETRLENVEIGEGPRGVSIVTDRGVLLSSAYDPVTEGQRLARQVIENKPDLLVALGFALGHHLEAYRAAHSGPIIVYEPSPERLRAAISARPGFTLLAAKDVEFAHDLEDLLRRVSRRYTTGLHLEILPHPALLRLDPDSVVEAVARLRRVKEASDISTGTRVNMAARWAGLTARNAAQIVRTPSFAGLYEAFEKCPVVIAAAGPSLDKQIPLLAEYRDRVLVIAIGQSLGSLRRGGIEPHLVHIVESQPVGHQLQKGGDSSSVNLVVTPDTDPSLFQIPVRTRFVATPASDVIGMWLARPLGVRRWTSGGGTVAQGAVGLALAMGSRQIMLIGQDLAFTDGRAYAKGSAYEDVGVRLDGDDKASLTNVNSKRRLFGYSGGGDELQRKVLWVDGWNGEKLPTSYAYATFIEHYRDLASALAVQGTELINCTEGGAYIPGLAHEPFRAALEERCGDVFDFEARIRQAYADWAIPDLDVYREPLEKVRRMLRIVENEAEQGVQRAEQARLSLPVARSPEKQIGILRGIGRIERKLHKLLGGARWLDQFVQPHIHAVRARSRQAEHALPSPDEAVDESLHLFRATLSGVEAARSVFDEIDRLLLEEVPLKRNRGRSETERAMAGAAIGG